MIVGPCASRTWCARCKTALLRGSSYGAPTAGEVDLAERIRDAYPSMQMLRMTSSGTEAVMGALRVARGFTGRDLVVKFEGAYHGGADYLLVKAGSGAATFGEPDSAGVPAAIAATTTVLPWNDESAASRVVCGARRRDRRADPRAGGRQHGLCPAGAGLSRAAARAHREQSGALLVFDEVMTGFRLAYGGAQARFGIEPDLTTLGKIIGGGLPVGAYGGRREVMERVSPLGPVYQAGTLSGNPLAVAAGLATLELLREPGVYERSRPRAPSSKRAFREAAQSAEVALQVQRVGSMLTPFFSDDAGALVGTTRPQRSQALRALSSRAARSRRVLAAVAVRSGLRVTGARRQPRSRRRARRIDRLARAMTASCPLGGAPNQS